ncbi:hypothetical protein Ddye_003643 [Dipteronia dyeriana]|uniref:BZIP domain-containing protein n=1 Tax=Dipteronia dyeriana TaxID=168575 RepID=A0AAD9XSN4_9ROSI|nr:hypothetical protein Ddye_003643 [Dipteronia dyeriana]
MGSHMNFKNFGEAPHGEGRPPGGNYPLARQPSVYSLTFEEFQNTWGGIGKDFGSMNMDELLKNIWTAEENQAMTSVTVNGEGTVLTENLQRQGSITLPRTLSQMTVDEVWRDLIKESSGGAGAPKEVSGSGSGGGGGGRGGGRGGGGSIMPQRQPTLGEITLEEFLLRAGVVREDANHINGSPNNGIFYANNNSTSLALGFQQPSRNNELMGNRLMQNNNSVAVQPPALALNVNGLRSLQQPPQQQQQHLYQPQQQQQQTQHHQYQPQQQQQQTQHHQYQPQQQQQQQQQPLFPKQTTVAFAPPMNLVNTKQLSSPGARGAVVTVTNSAMNNNLIQAGGMQNGGMGMVGLGTGSPASQVSPDMIARSSADTSSSPVPYVFGRGRKSGAVEKVVERRHRRMIKNRESAARSRARKQAYTLELEAEIAKLKELNQELQKKQEETVDMQNDQTVEKMRQQWGGKRHCLRRTLTGPW